MSLGASMAKRMLSPLILTTVTTILSPMTIRSPTLRVSANILFSSFDSFFRQAVRKQFETDRILWFIQNDLPARTIELIDHDRRQEVHGHIGQFTFDRSN